MKCGSFRVITFLVLFGFISGSINIILVLAELNDRGMIAQSKALLKCVDILINPYGLVASPSGELYSLSASDRFFCPASPYSATDTLTVADNALKQKNVDIQLRLKEDTTGKELSTMLGRENHRNGKWLVLVNGRKYDPSEDPMFLPGAKSFHWYFQEQP